MFFFTEQLKEIRENVTVLLAELGVFWSKQWLPALPSGWLSSTNPSSNQLLHRNLRECAWAHRTKSENKWKVNPPSFTLTTTMIKTCKSNIAKAFEKLYHIFYWKKNYYRFWPKSLDLLSNRSNLVQKYIGQKQWFSNFFWWRNPLKNYIFNGTLKH